MTNVLNLSTLEERHYSSLAPEQAVVAAHAQSKGDWNTWQYSERYADLVRRGHVSVGCGDWACLLKVTP